jgi:hypothetical protein
MTVCIGELHPGTCLKLPHETPRNDEGKRELDMVAQKEADRRAALQGSDRITDWAKRNQYSIIGTSWLAGVGASSAIIMRDR